MSATPSMTSSLVSTARASLITSSSDFPAGAVERGGRDDCHCLGMVQLEPVGFALQGNVGHRVDQEFVQLTRRQVHAQPSLAVTNRVVTAMRRLCATPDRFLAQPRGGLYVP